MVRFRGETINGEWCFGLLSESKGYKGQPEKGFYISNSAGMPWAYRVRSETVGMGVEINGIWWFEGDIFNLGDSNIKYQVVWNDIAIMGKQIGSSSYIGLSFWNKIMTLVGNKWDNPELLGGRNEQRD